MYEVDRVLTAKNKNKNKNFLSKLWNSIRKNIHLKKALRIGHRENKFSGWGMEIKHSKPPWTILPKDTDLYFLEINNKLLNLIKERKFRLTQFEHHDTDYEKILDELKWRHYLIYNCALGLCNVNEKQNKTLVECGVCDGLTFFFAAHALSLKEINFDGFLYDSWSKFSFDKKEDIFDYSYLNVDIAKKNLKEFEKFLTFNEGNIPEVFKDSSNPSKVDFIHIDLNSREATLNSLNFFYDKISSDGVIIFDDYGRIKDEKEVIDKFFINKKGNFISLPTGQAIFFKK